MLLFSIHPSSSKQNPRDHLCFAVRSRELENKWHEYNSDIYQQPPRIRWPVIISDQETDPAVQKIQMLDWPHCVQGCNMNRKMWNPGKKKKGKEADQETPDTLTWWQTWGLTGLTRGQLETLAQARLSLEPFVGGLCPKWGHRQLTLLTQWTFFFDIVLRATEMLLDNENEEGIRPKTIIWLPIR